jgi:hypothetical protein
MVGGLLLGRGCPVGVDSAAALCEGQASLLGLGLTMWLPTNTAGYDSSAQSPVSKRRNVRELTLRAHEQQPLESLRCY